MNNWFYDNSTTGGTCSTMLYDTITTATTETYLPDPLIDWLPYKVEKYIPTWHLMRSYK